jgi:nucleoside phosphorylase
MDEQHGRAVIVTALGFEYDAVRVWLARPEPVVHPSGTRYEIGRLTVPEPAWEVVLAETGEGNHAAAAVTGQAIHAFNPDLVLFVGIAGSMVDSVSLGDVVAATRVDAYHGGKAVGRQFFARPVTWPAAWRLDQAAREARRDGRWRTRIAGEQSPLPEVHLKPILAGEVVLDSRESRLYKFLRQHYNDAVAVEMEGAGLASAAHVSGEVPAMVLRGISDLAGGAKEATDAAGWQPRAARHAAAFAVELLVALDPQTLPRRVPAEQKSASEADNKLRGLEDQVSVQAAALTGEHGGKVMHLSIFRSGERARADAPDAENLHDLIVRLSELAEVVTVSCAAGQKSYFWPRVNLYEQLQQIQAQLDKANQWLGRTGLADELSTFELRHALRRYPGAADEFTRALMRLETKPGSSEQRSYLRSYEAASRSLKDVLWQIQRGFAAAGRGHGPSGKRS